MSTFANMFKVPDLRTKVLFTLMIIGVYRFDESMVADYYLQLDQAEIQSTLDIEAYPKAGTPNGSAHWPGSRGCSRRSRA